MKVTIKDPEALSAIVPLDLKRYILKKDFTLSGSKLSPKGDTTIGEVYVSPYMDNRHRSCEVVVIDDMSYNMYPQIMASNLAELEIFTGESQLQVFTDITQIPVVFTPSMYFYDEEETDAT